MALMTMIARVVDGLPLVGTMQEDEQVRNPFKKKYPKHQKLIKLVLISF